MSTTPNEKARVALFMQAFGEYKWALLVLTVLSFVSGFLEGIGINAVIPLFSFVDAGTFGTDFISRSIEGVFSLLAIDFTLRSLLVFIVLLFVLKAIVLFLASYLATRITVAFETRVRKELFAATLEANWPYLSMQKIGHLDQVLTTDIDQSSKLLTYVSATIIVVANIIAYGAVAINISVPVAGLAFIAGGLILLVLKPLFNKNTQFSKLMGHTYKELAHYVNEHMLGMKTVKASEIADKVQRKSTRYFDLIRGLHLKVAILRNTTTALLQPVGLFFVIGVFAFFYKTTVFNFASFAVMVYAINKIFAYIQQLQSNIHTITAQVPYLQSVFRYGSEAKAEKEHDEGTKPFSFKRELSITGVSFSFPKRGEVLSNVSFSLKKGEMVGLIGPSGAGKTTVVDLLLRLYAPENGGIFLDGEHSANIDMRAWRHSIGYVSQEIFLLNDTVANNIRFYNSSIDDETMREAARMAHIAEFIESLPQKYETVIGERGVLLSGGQRQRIILARTLARKPQLLVLDEATSALDSESELLIQKSIEELKGKVTVLAIAHRLSTVLASHRLIVLEKGKVLEEGTPDSLLKNKDSYFFKVYNLRT